MSSNALQAGKPDTDLILSGLKDFQLATVEHVFARLYTDPDYSRRYLVADEVGLGKTLVARGVIAKTIDFLWERTERIDIVYVCSNVDIARQNINRLNVSEYKNFALSSRITLLPLTVAELEGSRVNFVSFTPGTSFDLKRSSGTARERALLYWMLRDAWELDFAAATRPFEGTSARKGFQWHLDFIEAARDRGEIHLGMQEQFVNELSKHPHLRKTYDGLVERLPPRKEIPAELRKQCLPWIGELRRILAETCLNWLEPDLIILDEFQRFKHLMDRNEETATDAAQLAEQLFNFQLKEDDDATAARVLLLSATPYKMFTTSAESEQDDHYADFRLTLNFLMDDPEKRSLFEVLLRDYRDELFRVAEEGFERLLAVKVRLETLLRSVMVRTERLAIGGDRDGMLVEKPMEGVSLGASDVRQYLGLQEIARELGHGDMLEYWKSAPYLLSFMEDYDIKRKLRDAIEVQSDSSLAQAFKSLEGGLLSRETIEKYSAVDPGNARLRSLAADTVGREAWRLLWIPPSLPYYCGSGPFADPKLAGFTKRLVFSNWRVVPKAIASYLSYEAERQMTRQFRKQSKNTVDARKKRRGLLRFTIKDQQPTGMTALGLLYPCRTLATQVDPLCFLADADATERTALAAVEQKISNLLAPILERFSSGDPGSADRWYWAAPILLDLHYHSEQSRQWFSQSQLAEVWGGVGHEGDNEAAGGWKAHVAAAQAVLEGDAQLGTPPDDLVATLARMCLGAPGVSAYRALHRVISLADQTQAKSELILKNQAGRLAHAFLPLFNSIEVMSLLRDRKREKPYWRSVLDYCVAGNLQSTLDEYMHVLVESLGLIGSSEAEFLNQLVTEISHALSLRTSRSQADIFTSTGRRIRMDDEPIRIRNHFAMRFGDQTRDDNGERSAQSNVRSSFNSPFWPFVLASTSVGQEGLDFHPYCHAVVHWNLPSNPVDLEQREGRVHRYKGHALRKNIAEKFSSVGATSGADPWVSMFNEARLSRDATHNDLYPFWISPDGTAKIERHIPLYPHSREVLQRESLRRALVLYRMVYGQNRQEDLIGYLQSKLSASQIEFLLNQCRIDLSP